MDEKGFFLEVAKLSKRVVSKSTWKAGYTSATYDGARDFITFLACICADSTFLKLTLLYKSEVYNVLDKWVQNIMPEDKISIGFSQNG